VTDTGPTNVGPKGRAEPAHVPTVAPSGESTPSKRPSRRWLPWAAILLVVAVALGIALPLTLGSSSSTATPTPTPPSTARTAGLSGSYFSTTVEDSSLLFLRLVQVSTSLTGALTVTTASASHTRLVDHRYDVVGSATGTRFTLTIAPHAATRRTLRGTYASGVITIVLADGTKAALFRGTLADYRALVVHDMALLLA
jgi:hypothetical protein